MKKVLVFLLLLFFWHGNSYADNWIKNDDYIPEKGWSESNGPRVFARLVDYPTNENDCNGSDKALEFNVLGLSNKVVGAFDVNNVYVDGIGLGEGALNVVQAEFAAHGQGWTLPYLWKEEGNGSDWSQYDGAVYACVGSVAQGYVNPKQC